MLRAGRGAALYAAQGRGKTNALAFVTQLVLRYRPEWEVFTNVPYPWWARAGETPPRLHLVESLSGLLRGLSNRTVDGKWSAVLIDEFDQVDTSHSWASAGSESWAKYLFVARHYMTRGPLVVFHSFNFIPLTIRGGDVGSPFKLVNVHGERRIGDLENPKGPWVGVIPESDLPYLTFGLRGFRIDVDVQDLEGQFTGPEFAGDVEAVARTTLAYLDTLATRSAGDTDRPRVECGSCHYRWAPRTETGGRCPRCGSYERSTHTEGARAPRASDDGADEPSSSSGSGGSA